jgi:hypothetical protein
MVAKPKSFYSQPLKNGLLRKAAQRADEAPQLLGWEKN